MKRRVNRGKKYTPSTLAKKLAVYTSDCERKNASRMSEVWKATGKNGKTPPHTLAALMARKSA